MENAHIPVMRDEAINALAIRADGVYLDGTFGRGGHACVVLSKLGANGRLLAMDKDPQAIAAATSLAANDSRLLVKQDSFANLDAWPETHAGLDGVFFDLGVSSPQLDDANRGFSFMADGPLDMRMNPAQGESVAQWLAHADEAKIAEVIWQFGEERFSRRIAKKIIETRDESPLETTKQLADLVITCVGRREPGKHPATRTFQALRIFINSELSDVELGLQAATDKLNAGGRLVVISFHSLEDRLVKRFILDQSKQDSGKRGLPPPPEKLLTLRAVGAAQKPSAAEIAANPRSRSAVLRVAERL